MTETGHRAARPGYDRAVLPVIWAVFTVCMVGGFITIAAYWLDVQDRPDLTFRGRVGWSLGILLFHFRGRAGSTWTICRASFSLLLLANGVLHVSI